MMGAKAPGRLGTARYSVVLAALLAPCVVFAGSGDLARVEQEVGALESAVSELEARVGPAGTVSGQKAITKFEDLLYSHMLGEFEASAEGFFGLVTTGALADRGLHRDAEWYLAEALLELGNFDTAEGRLAEIVADEEHPFRVDAVRGLLDLYARLDRVEDFRRVYEAEVLSGRVTPSGRLTYSLARGFYGQGQLDEAKRNFLQVPESDPWYAKARYLLGAIAVREQSLDEALERFGQAANVSITSPADREVTDQALLAIGRIHYERGAFMNSLEAYNLIPGDSAYQADQLYEVVWACIRQELFTEALQIIEVFLLGHPDHQYAGPLRVIQGHLAVRSADWDGALSAYQAVAKEYDPIRVRLASFADVARDPAETLGLALDVGSGEVREIADLPGYAVAMVAADPELQRAVGVFRGLEEERQQLDQSEQLVAELEALLRGGSALSGARRARCDGLDLLAAALRADLDLAEVAGAGGQPTEGLRARVRVAEDQVVTARAALVAFDSRLASARHDGDQARQELDVALAAVAAAERAVRGAADSDRGAREAELVAARAPIPSIQAKIAAADASIAALVPPDLDNLLAGNELESGVIRGEVDSFAKKAPSQPAVSPVSARVDSLQDRLGAAIAGAIELEHAQADRIRSRFDAEVTAVAAERASYDATVGDAREVSLALTRQGFRRVEDFFADSVMKADMGVVDVFWAQKLEADDEIERVKEERELVLGQLQRRFDLIRNKTKE